MPNVDGKKFPYTKEGKMRAVAAMRAKKNVPDDRNEDASKRKPVFTDINNPKGNIAKFGRYMGPRKGSNMVQDNIMSSLRRKKK